MNKQSTIVLFGHSRHELFRPLSLALALPSGPLTASRSKLLSPAGVKAQLSATGTLEQTGTSGLQLLEWGAQPREVSQPAAKVYACRQGP